MKPDHPKWSLKVGSTEFPYFLTERRKIGQRGNALREVLEMTTVVQRLPGQCPGIGLPLERKGMGKKERWRGREGRQPRSPLEAGPGRDNDDGSTSRQPRGHWLSVPRFPTLYLFYYFILTPLSAVFRKPLTTRARRLDRGQSVTVHDRRLVSGRDTDRDLLYISRCPKPPQE